MKFLTPILLDYAPRIQCYTLKFRKIVAVTRRFLQQGLVLVLRGTSSHAAR